MRNVAVVGGCSAIPGLITRLKSELRTIASEMNLKRTSPRPVTLCFVQCFRTDRRKAWKEMPDRQAAKRHLLRYNVGLLRLRVLPRIAEYAGLLPVVLCGGADALALGGTVLLHLSLQHLQGTNQDISAVYGDGKTWATTPKLPLGLASRYKFLSKNAYDEMGPCLSHVAFALDEIEHRKYDRWKDDDEKPYFYSRSTGECMWDLLESDPEEKWMPSVCPLLFPFEGYEFYSNEMNKRNQVEQYKVRNCIFRLLVFLSALDENVFLYLCIHVYELLLV